MNKEALALWISALESGKYAQTRCPLHDKDGFDVLGVLVEAYRLKFGGAWVPARSWCKELESGHVERMEFLNCSYLPANEVMSWLGAKCGCKRGVDKHKPDCDALQILRLAESKASFIDAAKVLRGMS